MKRRSMAFPPSAVAVAVAVAVDIQYAGMAMHWLFVEDNSCDLWIYCEEKGPANFDGLLFLKLLTVNLLMSLRDHTYILRFGKIYEFSS
jgi:hypothetical protein